MSAASSTISLDLSTVGQINTQSLLIEKGGTLIIWLQVDITLLDSSYN